MIPYARQTIDKDDIEAVMAALKSDFLTTGPLVQAFEAAVAAFTNSKYAVAVSSGTAALHCVMHALDIRPGDEVIVPPITFAATANSICFLGGTPIFADVEPGTLLIDISKIEEKITPKTRAVIGVDYAGQPCDWNRLKEIAEKHNLHLVADACQALGGEYHGSRVGSLADMTVFSFHPVKQITTGEGGMITTDNERFAQKMRRHRNHGITTDAEERKKAGSWFYEMTHLGYNYRLSDIHAALGLSQMKKLPGFIQRRNEIAETYDTAFNDVGGISPLQIKKNRTHARHLYVIRIRSDKISRSDVYRRLRQAGIGVNVHHIPVHLHPYYKQSFGYAEGQFPMAEKAYDEILSLPLWPGMVDQDIDKVISEVTRVMVT